MKKTKIQKKGIKEHWMVVAVRLNFYLRAGSNFVYFFNIEIVHEVRENKQNAYKWEKINQICRHFAHAS